VSKHWPNNLGVGSFPTNVVELVKVDVKFEEELEEFYGSFDRDEMVDMYFFSFFIVHLFFTLIFTSFFVFLVLITFPYKICEIQVVNI
jgi:hypothetical protein